MAVANFDTDEAIFYRSPPANSINLDSSLVQIFNEKQDFVLPQNVSVNNPADWNQQLKIIPKGTAVDSHYIWFNPRFVNATSFFRAIATIRFETPILGIIGGNGELISTNTLLGLPNIIYPDDRFGARQMDNRNPDGSRDSAVANGTTLRFDATARDGVDPVRVITAAFPTPVTQPAPQPSRPPVAAEFAVAPALVQAGASNPSNRIQGTRNNDVLKGNRQQNILLGKAGDDRLSGKGENDTIRGARGDDRAFGGRGNDQLVGGEGADRLIGGVGNDVLIGGKGNDFLTGQAGEDVLTGGDGNDTLTGGDGNDLFVFRRLDDAVDTIQDFTVGADLIDLRGIFTTVPSPAQFAQFIRLTQVGANTELRISTNPASSESALLATLVNTAASRLSTTNFIVA